MSKQGVSEETSESLLQGMADTVNRMSYDVKVFTDFLNTKSFTKFIEAAQVDNR